MPLPKSPLLSNKKISRGWCAFFCNVAANEVPVKPAPIMAIRGRLGWLGMRVVFPSSHFTHHFVHGVAGCVNKYKGKNAMNHAGNPGTKKSETGPASKLEMLAISFANGIRMLGE